MSGNVSCTWCGLGSAELDTEALKRYATDYPIGFGVFITLTVLGSYIAAGVLAAVVAGDAYGREIAAALRMIAAALFFASVLWRFGRLRAAGVAHLGGWELWLLALAVLG
jgi:hypothetical protein